MSSRSWLPGEAAKSKCKPKLQLVKKWDHIKIKEGGFCFKLTFRGTNKTKVKTKLFLLTFPLFPSLGCCRKSREALPPPCLGGLMVFLWQQNRGFVVLSSLQTPPDSFPKDLPFFYHNKQIHLNRFLFFFSSSKWLWFSGPKPCMRDFFPLFKFSGRIRNRISLVLGQIKKLCLFKSFFTSTSFRHF